MTPAPTETLSYEELSDALAAEHLQGLWAIQTALMPALPRPATRAWLWRGDVLLALARRAGEVVTIERGGDRRVLALANPGLGGRPFASTTLWAAIQYLGPGESAPAHRHSPSAIRFVMQGRGAHTTVDGDACPMEEGDLILTPAWTWHDHNSTSDEAMVWFDGLDLPLAATLEAIFFEHHPLDRQPVDGHDRSRAAFAAPGLRDVERPGATTPHSPLLRYPWADTDRALTALQRARGGPLVAVEYVDPATGRPAVPTFRCEMVRLLPDGPTPTTRRTGSTVFVAFRGSGHTVIDGTRFDWAPGDIFVVPSWAAVSHRVEAPADLFTISDRPVLEALHLYAEATVEGDQAVTGTFAPGQP